MKASIKGAPRKSVRRSGGAPEEARLAVNLPIALHRQLKARAAEHGVSIRDYVLSLLEKDGLRR